jgi:hypothetical protein
MQLKGCFILKNYSVLIRSFRSGGWFLKTISLALLLSFFVQEISFADLDLKPIQWETEKVRQQKDMAWAKKMLLPIPESVATIEDAWQGPSSNKTIYLIQDAHTNTSGQFNVA